MADAGPTMTADRVQSLVLDLGSHSTRAGYSGDDTPTLVFASCVSFRQGNPEVGHESAFGACDEILPIWELSPFQGKIYRHVREPRFVELLLDYILGAFHIGSQDPASLVPILIVDPIPVFSVESKQLICQHLFEKCRIKGLYFVNNAVVNAFALGKHSALVVDIGASGASVVGVSDGFVSAHSWQRLGGDFLTDKCEEFLSKHLSDECLVPYPQVSPGSKAPVSLGERPKFKFADRKHSASFIRFHQRRLLEDFKASVVQVAEMGSKESELALKAPKFYEFPNGFNKNFGAERFELGEHLFSATDQELATIVEQIEKVHQNVDSYAAASIIVCGGGSLAEGLCERISSELQARLPRGYGRGSLKILYASSVGERRHSTWIGGSVLASIGSFQRVWVAPQEFSDIGLAAFDRRPYAAAISLP